MELSAWTSGEISLFVSSRITGRAPPLGMRCRRFLLVVVAAVRARRVLLAAGALVVGRRVRGGGSAVGPWLLVLLVLLLSLLLLLALLVRVRRDHQRDVARCDRVFAVAAAAAPPVGAGLSPARLPQATRLVPAP